MYNLTLNMIVKNEAPNIERCLESVAPFIDYYVICDTGSTDNTKEVIKNFFEKKGIPGEILDHEWKHFGHNRTLALKACHGKTKWALMIDADDFISGKLPVEKFDDSVDGYVVKIKRGPYEWYRGQIFNLGKKLWWYEEPLHEYAICEQPMKVEKLEGDYEWEVRTEGCRSRESGGDDREKYRRDYVFLKKYLEEHPDKKSFCYNGILKTIKETLQDQNQDIQIIDLYKENKKFEFSSEKVNEYKEMVTKADRIYFISPVWWFRCTPLLESFFDQIFTPGFAYKFIPLTKRYGYPKPLLSDKKVR